MNETAKNTPTMLFDGECGFCRQWARKWHRLTGKHVRYAPYQDALDQFPQLTAQQCAVSVQLIMPDGRIYSGAQGIFRALDLAGRYQWLLRLYETRPLFARVAERLYQLVAHHRVFFSKLA